MGYVGAREGKVGKLGHVRAESGIRGLCWVMSRPGLGSLRPELRHLRAEQRHPTVGCGSDSVGPRSDSEGHQSDSEGYWSDSGPLEKLRGMLE